MLQFLDKSTLGYAAIFGIVEDTVSEEGEDFQLQSRQGLDVL